MVQRPLLLTWRIFLLWEYCFPQHFCLLLECDSVSLVPQIDQPLLNVKWRFERCVATHFEHPLMENGTLLRSPLLMNVVES